MTVTPADFKLRYPEFDPVDDARVQIFLDDAALEMCESAWGDLYDRGQAALAAHMLAIANQTEASGGTGGGASGPVASRSIGDVSVSFGLSSSSSKSEDWYTSTPYGSDYWRLVKIVGMGAVVVC